MHGVIAEAGVQWDPNKWNGDSWDSVDSDEIGSPDEFVDVRPAWINTLNYDDLMFQKIVPNCFPFLDAIPVHSDT